MDLSTRTRLYARVESVTGKTHIKLKAVEEFTELINELSSVVTKQLQCEPVTKCDMNKLLDEIADTIITFEQCYGVEDVRSIIDSRIALKLERLEKKYLSGNLFSKLWGKLKEHFNE